MFCFKFRAKIQVTSLLQAHHASWPSELGNIRPASHVSLVHFRWLVCSGRIRVVLTFVLAVTTAFTLVWLLTQFSWRCVCMLHCLCLFTLCVLSPRYVYMNMLRSVCCCFSNCENKCIIKCVYQRYGAPSMHTYPTPIQVWQLIFLLIYVHLVYVNMSVWCYDFKS